ncbi:hypothetical protein BB561_005451 [Smittium simulii]|uniref:Transforming acidic coiled-coil-containing protein C-terminal domain-containing protein n=1 Tax=Smittium simulii TaxID=133385 RepID=A0A2T9YAE3_9FUNG|nr:hypothetical protein BB561_005451 [Smittium simulii]
MFWNQSQEKVQKIINTNNDADKKNLRHSSVDFSSLPKIHLFRTASDSKKNKHTSPSPTSPLLLPEMTSSNDLSSKSPTTAEYNQNNKLPVSPNHIQDFETRKSLQEVFNEKQNPQPSNGFDLTQNSSQFETGQNILNEYTDNSLNLDSHIETDDQNHNSPNEYTDTSLNIVSHIETDDQNHNNTNEYTDNSLNIDSHVETDDQKSNNINEYTDTSLNIVSHIDTDDQNHNNTNEFSETNIKSFDHKPNNHSLNLTSQNIDTEMLKSIDSSINNSRQSISLETKHFENSSSFDIKQNTSNFDQNQTLNRLDSINSSNETYTNVQSQTPAQEASKVYTTEHPLLIDSIERYSGQTDSNDLQYDYNDIHNPLDDDDSVKSDGAESIENINLSESFSKINLVNNDDSFKSHKRSFNEIITPFKNSSSLLGSANTTVSSPMRAPPPFKKLMSQLNSDKKITDLKYEPQQEITLHDFNNQKTLNSNISILPIYQESETSTRKNSALSKDITQTLDDDSNKKLSLDLVGNLGQAADNDVSMKILLTPESNKNLMSMFDPYASISEAFRVSTPDLYKHKADQKLASLIPLPDSPEKNLITSNKKNLKPTITTDTNLLVPVTPSSTQWSESNINWESPTVHKLYKDSDIEKQNIELENKQKELELETLRHQMEQLLKQKDQEIENFVDEFEKQKQEYKKMAQVATEKLEAELVDYKIELEKGKNLTREILEKNDFLSLKLDTIKLDCEQKFKLKEIAVNEDYQKKLNSQQKEYEEKIQEIQKANEKKNLDLEHDYKDFEQQLREIEEGSSRDIANLKIQLENEKKELESVQREYQEYIVLSSNYMDSRDKENEGLTKVIASVTLENHQYNEKLTELSDELVREQENSKKLQESLNETQNKNKTIISEKETLEKDLNVAVERENLIVNHFKEQIEKDNEKINSLTDNCAKLDQENEYLKTQLARLEFSLKKSNKEISNLKEENIDLNRMYSNLEQMVSNRR